MVVRGRGEKVGSGGGVVLPAEKRCGWFWLVQLLEGSGWPEWWVRWIAMLHLTTLSALDHLSWRLLHQLATANRFKPEPPPT